VVAGELLSGPSAVIGFWGMVEIPFRTPIYRICVLYCTLA
jgi:hypothetical protein